MQGWRFNPWSRKKDPACLVAPPKNLKKERKSVVMVWPFSAKAHTWWKKWKWIRMLAARGDQLVQVPQETKNTQIMSVCHPLHRFRVSRWDPLQGTMCVACHCPELWHGVRTTPRSFLSSFQPFLQQWQNLVLPTKLTEISLSKFLCFMFYCFLGRGRGRDGRGWSRAMLRLGEIRPQG